MEFPSLGNLVSSLLGSQGEDGTRGLNNFFYCIIKKKTKKNKKAPFVTHWCLDTAKVPLHLSFSLLLYLEKFCVQAFLSLGSAEESSRGFHALLTFVSSLWWCFWISPHQEWVWSEVTEVIGFKCDQLNRGKPLQPELLCNLGVFEFEAVQFGMNPVLHFAMNTPDCREELSCTWGFPNKLNFFFLIIVIF